ncbi:MAG: hypothetical protein KDB80_02485, partial [Planctomycetes bacterium]|nr:hypothetical protein [Planctomycetota bacterium]
TDTHQESGTALILSLFFAIVVTGIVATGSIYQASQRRTTETQFRVYSQANQFARAGLTEALSWFRRQPSQPVTGFEPVVDLAANPQILDTIDSDIGIVREFNIEGNTWGRYEVWKEWGSDPDATRLAWRQQVEATDVSAQRGLGTPGSTWRLRGVGYVYHYEDATKAFDEGPNRVLATRILESEILRLKITPPGQAALCVSQGSDAQINNNGRIYGGSTGAGIFYPNSTGTPGWTGGATITGAPALTSTATYGGDYKDVFGITYSELRGIADLVVASAADFPSPIGTNNVVITEVGSTMTFDSSTPLRGTGLVIVNGDAVISAGSASTFTGFLYVDGDLTINAPAEITGAVVVTGRCTVQGSGDYSTITFDDDALTALRIEIGQYRMSGAIRPIHSNE